MRKPIRIASLMLAMLMLATTAIACGNKDTTDPAATTANNDAGVNAATTIATETTETTGATEATVATDAYGYPALPEKDMQGFQMRFFNYDNTYLTWVINQLDAETITGDLVNDAIFERNTRMEETYNCVISEQTASKPHEELAALIQAGDLNAEIVMLYDEQIASNYIAGRLLTWDEMTYVDFDQPYWSKNAIDTYTMGGKTFAATGDFSLSMTSRSFCLMYNKGIYNEIGQTEDLYQLTRDGKWTMEKLATIAASAARDLNGDGAMTLADDRFGAAGAIKQYFGSLVTGAGIKYVEKNAEGNYIFALPGDERASTIMSDILAKHSGNHAYVQTKDGIHSGDSSHFKAGRILFQGSSVKGIVNYRTMDDDIGILPFPKYDEEQENYYALTSGGSMATIPATINPDSFDNVSLILEAMSRDSHETVLETYKEVVLKSKYARDEGSADMLSIIFGSIACDVGLSVIPNETYYKYMEIFMSGQDTFASTTKAVESVVNKQLERLKK